MLRALTHAAHQSLQARAGCDIRHSHVHELLAAAFGYRTWAALTTDALLADHGVGQTPEASAGPQIAGRALQLQYGQTEAQAMTGALMQFIVDQHLGLVRWTALAPLLPMSPPSKGLGEDEEDDESDDDLEGWDDASRPVQNATVLPREHFLASGLLLNSLEVAATKDPRAHQILAALFRCSKPNPYLYEESLKGRELTASERGWVEQYRLLAPRAASSPRGTAPSRAKKREQARCAARSRSGRAGA
ncbi:MAG: hypothetical protein JSR49_07555, partial [Proteobacteria bacterium]|nr:hypothetical protein [Pseudomonadota bacterium]